MVDFETTTSLTKRIARCGQTWRL